MSVSTELATTKRGKAELAEQLSFTPEQMQLIRDTVAKGATENEFMLFMHLAQHYGLDPFLKEIWCIKYVPKGRDPRDCVATIFTSRDGYLKIASRTPEMDGIQSDVVYANDVLEKLTDGTVSHRYGNPRGVIVGAYALVWRKDRSRPAYFFAPLSEYNGGGNPTWQKYPSAMIVKVAEAMALKRAFSISGLVTQEELGLEVEPAEELATGAVVLEEPKPTAKTAAVSEAGATASTSPATPATSGLSEADERALAGHRTRLLYARSISEVQQIWQEAKHLQKHLVADKDAAKTRLNKAKQQVAPAEDIMAEFVQQPTVGMGLSLASEAQLQDVQRLINLQTFTGKEKADMLLVLRKLDEVRADQAVLKLLTVLAEREGRDNDKELRQALHRFVVNYGPQLGEEEVERLTAQANDSGVHWYELRREIMRWKQAFAQAAAVAA